MSRFFNKYIFIIIGFYIIWLGILPFTAEKLLPAICENISYNSNYIVKLERPTIRTSILPKILLKADSIELKEKNTNNFINVDSPFINLRILPILSGKLHINKIGASNLKINLTLDKHLVLDKDFFKNLSKINVKCDSVYLNEFDIKLYQQNIQTPVIYNGKKFFYKRNNRYVKLDLESKILLNGNKSEADIELYLPQNNDVRKSIIDVKIINLDISPIGEYFRNYLPKDMVKLKGIIDIDIDKNHLSASFKNCAIFMKDSAKSIIFPEKLDITSDFNITRKTITIKNADILSDNINMSIKGTISDFLDRTIPDYNIKIVLNKSRIEDFINFMPPIKTPDFNVYKLKKYKFYGNILGNLTVKGNSIEPAIYGDIYIDDGILTEKIAGANGSTIKLKFIGRSLSFDAKIPASQKEKVWVKGNVELYNTKYADLRVWSTKNINLSVAEDKINPLHEILNFIAGPLPIMNIKGVGNFDITVKGTKQNPHIWGVLILNNITANFKQIPNMIVNNSETVLNFEKDIVSLTTKGGFINGKEFDMKGTSTVGGKFNFDFASKNQNLSYFYNAIQTSSSILDDLKTQIPKLDEISGLADINMKIFGEIQDINKLKFNKNIFASGQIDLLGNSFELEGIKICDTKGILKFNKNLVSLDTNSKIGNSPLISHVSILNNLADVSIKIPKLNLNDIMTAKDQSDKNIGNIMLSVEGSYHGKIDKIEYDKIDMNATVLGSKENNKLQISEGNIIIKNNNLNIKNLKGHFADSISSFGINLIANNISSKPVCSGNILLKDFELSLINDFQNYLFVPTEIREYLKQIHFDKGKINLNAKISNNNIVGSTDIGGIAFTYKPQDIKIQILNGSIFARKNFLGLDKINILADDMPILIDGGINDIFSKQVFDLYINSKPKQEFIDKYINNNRIYPIKIKGDIVYSLIFKGIKDNYNLSSTVNMAKDSSIYYLGATVGDIENAIVLNLDMQVIKQNLLKIKEFSYDKIIDSQGKRKTRLNMLKADGDIEISQDDLKFDDLRIKTSNPTDARIFNILFRKPNIKQGQFTSNLKFNGTTSNPQILGSFHIFETNIPFLDTTMKNITFLFKDKTIELSSLGEVLGNDITFKGTLKNKLTIPYFVEDAEVYTKVLDLDNITNKIKSSQVDNNYQTFESLNPAGIIIKNLKMKADSIKLRNIHAENVEASASISENKVLNIKNYKFKIANGTLNGNFVYNLISGQTSLDLSAKNIDANDITYALFDFNNQIYGNLTGEMKISCDGSNFNTCMKTLNGNSTFNVVNGRMPKLGSLEYLLRAGNLIKGGLTGLSMNSIIDIITPLKTGEFSEIYGTMNIKDGIADNVEISTKGNNLSLFITGTYNFSTADANMEVLGMLSKKISTLFGPIGNVSLNTLLNVIPGIDLDKNSKLIENINKIPGIELSSNAYRKFIAIIQGNINGEDYVKSFKWIN